MKDRQLLTSGIAQCTFLMFAGITFFSVISPTAIAQGMGPWMMYGDGPGYNINATNIQTGYGLGYWMGPWMMYGYGPGSYMGYGPGYSMGPWMMYGSGPGYIINATSSQLGYGPSYSLSIADELNKLADLKKNGTITNDEFNQLKSQLINKK
jgi:Short C-terminal domain